MHCEIKASDGREFSHGTQGFERSFVTEVKVTGDDILLTYAPAHPCRVTQGKYQSLVLNTVEGLGGQFPNSYLRRRG
jgi:chitinase